MQEIKNAAVPYNTVGLVEVRWTPLAGPEESDVGKPLRDVEDADQLLGKSNTVSVPYVLTCCAGHPWTYRLDIKRCADLPVFCEMAYVSYEFFGETFTTGNSTALCSLLHN